MKAKIKHDMEFFYKFMKAHGYYEMDVYYFWNVFISGADYHKDPNLSKDEIEDIDLFDRVYGGDYERMINNDGKRGK